MDRKRRIKVSQMYSTWIYILFFLLGAKLLNILQFPIRKASSLFSIFRIYISNHVIMLNTKGRETIQFVTNIYCYQPGHFVSALDFCLVFTVTIDVTPARNALWVMIDLLFLIFMTWFTPNSFFTFALGVGLWY